ncbi:MAG: RNA polymerase sigma factor RpoD/SigA, partial [Gemmatimonadota bacterium]
MPIGCDDNELMRAYFDDIAHSEPLTREREVELAARIRQGDLGARDELVQANLRFVVDVARHYRDRGLSMSELVSAGNLGLMKAADRFDGERGFKFISYAVWWIRQSIHQALAEQARTIRLPVSQLSLLKQITRVSRGLNQSTGQAARLADIADEIGVTQDEVESATARAQTPVSLDQGVEDAGERRPMDALIDTSLPPPDAAVAREQLHDQIEALVDHLEGREQLIVRRYYGLDG